MSLLGKPRWNRRTGSRESIVVEGIVSTLATSRTVILDDISGKGARFRSAQSPELGKDVLVRIGHISALAKVVWRNDRGCGVQFDQQVGEHDLARLRAEDISSSIADLSGEERLAAQEWISGFAR
jgi:hypothetical protein